MSGTRCPSCGTVFPDGAKFCPKDGTKLLPLVASGRPAAGAAASTGGGQRNTEARAPSPAAGTGKPAVSHANMVGHVLDGRYEIAKKIGEGGMSYVYLAHDVATRVRYAIKILSPALAKDANAMARLKREAGLGIRLAHPNVCHIMRLGETEDGLVYIVMPYVDGELLVDRTNKSGHLPLDVVVGYVRDIASGLTVAHELKIIHRDLKPENVMVCKQPDGTDRAVVMDFGLAKERKAGTELEKLTATGIILGTPEFMSPEQLRGKPLDPRTDVYSLALMTFEMLTGKLPFQGRTQQEMMIARLRSDPTPVRRMKPELNLPASVERVLLKGMERNPDDRYQTAMEFANAFAQAATEGDGAGDGGGLLGRVFGR